MSVSWECQEELFRQEVENADDLRLSQRLFKKCMGDKKKFCSDIKFGARLSCMTPRPRQQLTSDVLPCQMTTLKGQRYQCQAAAAHRLGGAGGEYWS